MIPNADECPESGRVDLGIYPRREGRCERVELPLFEHRDLLMPMVDAHVGIQSNIALESSDVWLSLHCDSGILDGLINRSIGS